MKKTALQQLIEQWNKELQQPLGVLEDHRAYHTNDIKEANRQVRELNKRIDQATELLETEREQIEDAWLDGLNSWGSEREAEQYYKENYK